MTCIYKRQQINTSVNHVIIILAIWQITPKNKELPYPLQLCNQRDYWLIWQYGNS